jgi:flagellar basal-body rod protein FlgF
LVRGIYTAATGAIAAESNIDMIANNMANVSTIGFKRQLLQLEAQPASDVYRWQSDPGTAVATQGTLSSQSSQEYVGQMGSGAQIYDTPTNFEQGSIELTNNDFDFAIYGQGFFAVRNAAGAVRYTRDGSFVRNANGTLTTIDGDTVVDSNGFPINIPTQGKVSVDPAGTLSTNGVTFGKIGIFDVSNPRVVRSGGANVFTDGGSAVTPDTTSSVVQHATEKSNSDVVRSIVDLIVAQRWFDANIKNIQTEDAATGLAISAVGNTTNNTGA